MEGGGSYGQPLSLTYVGAARYSREGPEKTDDVWLLATDHLRGRGCHGWSASAEGGQSRHASAQGITSEYAWSLAEGSSACIVMAR